ncbi:MAG: OmpA family protein [Muribaculaceae bacterium]|jgi:outer membrane protein OmpA-like peptidoglycan-associated protein|nr:OmpA family protein [Muribaculaceae bacterium]
MKLIKITGSLLMAAVLMLSSSCATMNNTGKGALIGGGGGAALGAGIGALIGGGKGAAIGGAIGAGVGAGAGALIGNKMDKQQKELEQIQGATVEETVDQNGLQAIKMTFDGGILFATGKSTLSASAQNSLTQFATSLINNPDTNVQIFGYTDNTGSYAANERVSNSRADAVRTFLVNKGVTATRITALGVPMADYVATNETAEGRAQNRRVEVYISANEEMIKKAEAGTLK